MIVLLLLLLWAIPAHAGNPPSLFLTPQESAAQNTWQGMTTLDSLVYYGQDQWQVRLNGRVLTPAARDPEFDIIDVTADGARFVQHIGDKERTITLAPHQSYLWNEDKVVEGTTPSSAAK
ncbi:MAG: hypothetical protein WDO70_09135 [Alphaproteobacteria bacterium]